MNQAVDLDEMQLFRDMARRAFEKEISPHYEQWEEDHIVPRSLWNTLGSAGLLCPDVAEEYGGAGTSPHVTLAMIEELSYMGFGGFASGYGIHSNIIAPYLSRHGSPEQKAHWLPRMVTGECVGALAMTEPGAGSDVQGIRTTAVRDGDEWVLNGSKIFITNGIHADLVIVAAITDPGKGAKGTSLFLVDAHLPGFEKSKKIEKIGQHTSDTALLFFTDVRLPASALLGEENKGFAILMDELPRERLGMPRRSLPLRAPWTSPWSTSRNGRPSARKSAASRTPASNWPTSKPTLPSIARFTRNVPSSTPMMSCPARKPPC